MTAVKADREETVAAMRPAWAGLWGVDEDGPYLIAGRCVHCGAAALAVRSICPGCLATDSMSEERIGRRGTVYTVTAIHQTPSGFEAPYRVGYVDVEHGLRMFAHIDERAAIGEDVTLALRPVRKDGSGALLEGPVYRATSGS